VLGTKTVDMRQLRRLAFHGIPDRDGMRATAWKVRTCLACMHACIFCMSLSCAA
jgi:hypothetical protein